MNAKLRFGLDVNDLIDPRRQSLYPLDNGVPVAVRLDRK